MTGPRNLRQRRRSQRRKMSMKNMKMATEESTEDRKRVQGIRDDDGGSSGLTTGLVDWQRQRCVNFPCYRVANSNTVSSLSPHCLFLIFFSSDQFFPFTARNTISTTIMRKIFLYQVYTKVLMINKYVRKSIARKNGNEILIWSWNNPIMYITTFIEMVKFPHQTTHKFQHLLHLILHEQMRKGVNYLFQYTRRSSIKIYQKSTKSC